MSATLRPGDAEHIEDKLRRLPSTSLNLFMDLFDATPALKRRLAAALEAEGILPELVLGIRRWADAEDRDAAMLH